MLGEAVDKNLFRPSKSIWPKGAHGLSLTVAFFLFNAEHFNVFGNKNVIRLFSDTLWSRPAELNLTSIIIACIGFFALMLLFQQKRYSMSGPKGLAVACALLVLSPALWALSRNVLYNEFLGYFGFALYVFGHLCFLPTIVKNLAVVGPLQALTIYAISTVLLSVTKPLLVKIPLWTLNVTIALLPLIMFACLKLANKNAPVSIELKKESKTKVPKVLVGTLIITGMLSGVYAETGLWQLGSALTQASIAESVVAALAIIFFLASSHLNYNRILYVISIPLMAYGIMLVLTKDLSLGLMGACVYQFGFDFLYAGLWSLYAYLVRYSTFNYYWLAVSAAFGTFLGRTISVTVIEGLRSVPSASVGLDFFILTVLFGAMLVAIMLYGQNNMKSGWGSVKIQAEFIPTDPQEQNCNVIAAVSNLTGREKDVLLLLSKGCNAKSISDRLCITPGTAKTHIKHVYNKLGVHSQQELINLVERNGQQLK